MDGISLVPILRKEKKSVRKYATSYWKDAISIRSQSHRLIAKVRNKKIIDKKLYNLTRKLDSIKDVLPENSEVGKELTRQVLER